jgi:hypothetical protein
MGSWPTCALKITLVKHTNLQEPNMYASCCIIKSTRLCAKFDGGYKFQQLLKWSGPQTLDRRTWLVPVADARGCSGDPIMMAGTWCTVGWAITADRRFLSRAFNPQKPTKLNQVVTMWYSKPRITWPPFIWRGGHVIPALGFIRLGKLGVYIRNHD